MHLKLNMHMSIKTWWNYFQLFGHEKDNRSFENMTLRRHATLLMVQFEKCKKGRKDCGFEEVATFFVMCLFILDLFKIRVNTIPFLRLTFHIKSTIQLQWQFNFKLKKRTIVILHKKYFFIKDILVFIVRRMKFKN